MQRVAIARALMMSPDAILFDEPTSALDPVMASEVLGVDRADPGSRPALAADPRVLTLIANVVRAAGAAGVKVSVCGDAAADPLVLPLLLGLGVRTLSVGAARVPRAADWIAAADTAAAARDAAEILAAGEKVIR